MEKIYETQQDVHCPVCRAKINKNTCKCTRCHFNALASISRYSGNNLIAVESEYRENMLSYSAACLKSGKYNEAAFYYQVLANHFQDTTSMYELGQIFLYGVGVDPNANLAQICFENAARLEHDPSIWMLGQLYYYGWYGFPCDWELSYDWLNEAQTIDANTIGIYHKLESIFFRRTRIYYKNDDEDEEEEELSEEEEEAINQWEIDQDDSMPHASDRDYYYAMNNDDDFYDKDDYDFWG